MEGGVSYEGYREWLCANGHYHARDCWDDDPKKCQHCGAPITHYHGVDQTNGVVQGDPQTKPAPKCKIGADDQWHKDHHGNKFAIAIPRYKPGRHWRELKAAKGRRQEDTAG